MATHTTGQANRGSASIFGTLWASLLDVLLFWYLRAYAWLIQRKPLDVLLETLASSNLYEEYEAAAFQLDEVLNYDLWRQNPSSKFYDYRLIYARSQDFIQAREADDTQALVRALRSGLVRNLGNITAARLYNRAYAGTKLMIEDYITQVVLAIDHVTNCPLTGESGLSIQNKMDLLHDTRQAFGRSVLVLQGGAIFGICHLGVVKALHLRGLLPRIISGTATGALIAALVCVHTENELLDFLKGSSIDLTAFTNKANASSQSAWYQTLTRRTKRFMKDGYFLDVDVLEEVVRANVEDLTFEEAYIKTRRVLNITVSTTGGGGIPDLLNYITAPKVLIRSAALASNATSSSLYKPVTLLCKDDNGAITPWSTSLSTEFRSWTHASYADARDSPLHRIAELFNVNHFIVSQARPYLAPFLRSDLHHPNPKQNGRKHQLSMSLLRFVVMEIQHRLNQANDLGILPSSIRRFLLDENVPGPSLTLVPELTFSDFFRLLENPTKDALDYWIKRGERSVWPAVGALKVRCAIEVEIDRGYQIVRRRKDKKARSEADAASNSGLALSGQRLRKSGSRGDVRFEAERRRAASFGEAGMR